MSNIEIHKANKRVDKILEFLKEKMPDVMFILSNHSKNFVDDGVDLFYQTFCEIISELSYGDKKKLDYKTFPWKEEVRKRMIENYGFSSTI